MLLNAEEQGLVGSRAYARDQAALGVDVVAVLQLDMIGYDVAPERAFELHAGFSPSPAVEQRSVALAGTVVAATGAVSPGLPAPQLYPVAGEQDPGEERSDHYSFQLNGFPACLASEDFFWPGPGRPGAGRQPELPLIGRHDDRRKLRPGHLPSRHHSRLDQRHPLRRTRCRSS